MIQRYTICKSREAISTRFEVKVDGKYKPNFNAKKSDVLPIITSDKPELIQYYQWGLVPYDSVDSHIGEKLINARSETVFAKKPFSQLIDQKRCFILADGFYLWQTSKNIPFRVTLKTNSLFAIAGIWEKWENEYENGDFFTSFSMLTTTSSDYLTHLSDRMPAIIQIDKEKKWFQKNYKSHMDDLFVTGDSFNINRVSNLVNDTSKNMSTLISPVNKEPEKGGELSLF